MTKKKKSKAATGKLSARDMRAELLRFFQRNTRKQFNSKQLLNKLKLHNDRSDVEQVLEKLAAENKITSLGDYKYKANRSDSDNHETSHRNRSSSNSRQGQEVVGRVDLTRSGAAYIVVEGQENDVYIAAKHVNTAMHGDQVKVNVWAQRGRRKPEGEIVEVIERAQSHFVGTVQKAGRNTLVVIDGAHPVEITIEPEHLLNAKEGEKVVAEITGWSGGQQDNPVGKITAVLGKAGSSNIEMQAILINNGFNIAFSNEVIAESRDLQTHISQQEINSRRDFREVTTLTIDPDDAKDFDDAISLQQLENGRIEVGVHIADVSHYVRPQSQLDQEAYRRSTSVYLVDRVCPMLPEQISNVLCSLRPEEDKLTFSAVFEMDENYQIHKRWFGKTIIHSNRRFTYNEAQERLESKEGDFAEELNLLNEIAKKLRDRRFKHGSIEFGSEEVKFRLDEEGTPVEVYVKERKEAHMLVEDFMLLANREVAAYINRKEADRKENIPFVYRVHDEPDPDRVAELALFAKAMGIEMDISNPRAIARSYNLIVKAAETDPGVKMLGPIAIRTMAKAIYTTENIGHYGLGFDTYTHFTSPIRRYADVLVHRILEKNLGTDIYKTNPAALEEECGHISRQERNAATAERESVKYKQVEYIDKHVGEEFPGIINGMADFGVFVELIDSHCEGMIPFEHMDEPYEISSGKLSMQGRRTGKVLHMGDPVQVKIVDTDLKQRRITMSFVEALPLPTTRQQMAPAAAKPEPQPQRKSKPASNQNNNTRSKSGKRKGGGTRKGKGNSSPKENNRK